MDEAHRQLPFSIRVDWGRTGAAAISTGVALAVVVDVLSFTTAVSVAVDAGIAVWPYRWDDEGAAAFAAEHDAVLAVPRAAAGGGRPSLSPMSLRTLTGVRRVVLPSPNGSTIAAELADREVPVLAASLRNANAVAAWIRSHHRIEQAAVAVVAAGEQWPDGGLRPAVEDLWGAGAVVSALLQAGGAGPSPEALVAAQAFESVRSSLLTSLSGCASGTELVATGWAADLAVAAELDASAAVPLLQDGAFLDATGGSGGVPTVGHATRRGPVARPGP